ncbi:GNAT family N-acetyltransferase [Trichoderma austrokoningii]
MTLPAGPVLFRTHRPGDIGYIIYRHSLIYAQDYQWDERFEAMVANIAAGFIQNYDPALERCWIAEQDGSFMGCVCIVRDTKRDNTARIRMLFVEPAARGLGLGKKLLQLCLDFAQEKGYAAIVLSTQSVLQPARALYQKAGFKFFKEEEDSGFKTQNSKGECWEMKL